MKRLISFYTFLFVVTVTSSCGQGSHSPHSDKYSYTNALIHESSPYLLMHAHNPVNWYPWSNEALAKAKKENKLLIISIGYSSCHWCHVMEKQSYSDTSVARFMNTHFVSVKVDREERPDIDQIYMNASQLLTGSGGWPLNAFALPDGRPFYAVTYLPKAQWLDLLHQIVKIYKKQPAKVTEQAEALTSGIRGQQLVKTSADTASENLKTFYRHLFDSVKTSIDFSRGGFTGVSKFPLPSAWEWLLQYHLLTGNEKSLQAVISTLDHIAYGGIYDQLGGGFARYSTDQQWRVPHFEKMLYDNGQLISLYAHAYQVTHNPLYADMIRQTLDFIKREMTSKDGGFYSSINADSQGEEGRFYVWTSKETDSLLDKNPARLIKAYYHITGAGNWEDGENILYRNPAINDTAFAEQHQLNVNEWRAILQKAKALLFKARASRIRPTTDNKILTSWNALMLKGYVDAYRALGDKQYLDAALKNAKFLENNMMQKDGHLWRNYMNGKADIQGLLDDYALLANAYIQLYQVTFDLQWLTKANVLMKYTVEHFRDSKNGLFFFTANNSEKLITRAKEIEDNVIPSSNSVMANVLYQLGIYYDDQTYIDDARAMMNQVLAQIPAAVPYFSNWAQLLGIVQKGPYEVAIMGNDALEKSLAMQRSYLPISLFMGGENENLPLLENKLMKNKTIIYVCENKVCRRPVTEVSQALEQLKK